jgi:DNA-binding NtrC family response regulator
MAILIVDDDPDVRAELREALAQYGDGWETRHAETAADALRLATDHGVACVLLDYRLPDADGLTCFRELRRLRPDLPVIVVTGAGSERIAVEAMKLGAADYVVKEPAYAQAVPGLVREALGRRALARAGVDPTSHGDASTAPPLDPATRARFEADGFVTRSPAMLRVLGLIARVAQSQANAVLITGESGTGKELCARALHAHSPRAARPFMAVNCAAVPEALLESELFGHVRGAFTGADRDRAGLFQQADGGTLFLDEIGEASPAVQAKLLRVLQEREVRPVGATGAPRRIDVRVVAATNRDLRDEGDVDRFRRDLYYRLARFPIVVPPLRDRRDDVALLARRFLERFGRDEHKVLAGFRDETLAVLERYDWPGNVRQLENEIHRLVVCAEPGQRIGPDAVDPSILAAVGASPATSPSLQEILRQVEAAVIQSRLREHGYRRDATARSLGVRRETLWKRLRSLGLLPAEPEDDAE